MDKKIEHEWPNEKPNGRRPNDNNTIAKIK